MSTQKLEKPFFTPWLVFVTVLFTAVAVYFVMSNAVFWEWATYASALLVVYSARVLQFYNIERHKQWTWLTISVAAIMLISVIWWLYLMITGAP